MFMAYDLNSYYNDVLSTNSLSKTIIDQLMKDNRFGSLSKITLPFNYGSGNANRDPIGYTETGRPIFENNVGVTMNDEMKDALAKKHARNTDTMLRGIGTNVIENTSTGNIAAFVSQGVIKAFIDEAGRFTGKIKLENIEDLNKLTLDTSRFYTKDVVDGLLTGKLGKADLFNDTKKIKSELLDADVVLHKVFDPHVGDDIRHITNEERDAWNYKYDKPVDGIPMKDLESAVSDRINASAKNVDLLTHTNNLDIHTSTAERTKWNAKYDKPATGVPMTDLSEIVQNAINTAAKQVDLVAHKENAVAHITGEERIKWNAKYDKPAGGVPFKDLEKAVQDKIDATAKNTDLVEHTNDKVVHITNAERLDWNGKYKKPSTGIPTTDLDSALQTRIGITATKDELNTHATDSTIHIVKEERDAWNSHKADPAIHITEKERSAWTAKYDRPSTGIPETDLSAGLQTKINGMVTTTDFNAHATDTVKHLTASERDKWNGKYDKPITGIPREHIEAELIKQINATATQANLDAHTKDSVAHVTASERAVWNNMFTKPSTGIPESDLELKFREKIASLATTLALTTHTGDLVKHVTVEDRNKWDAKYLKPVDGIPASDLTASLKNTIEGSAKKSDLDGHTADVVAHITKDERSTWNAQYTKPATGIPETDLEQAMRTKINGMVSTTDFNAHATDTNKHITASERTAWNAKYNKPNTGIPEADLTTGLATKINSAATQTALDGHASDTAIHTTDAERSKWNAKYDKPAGGVPEADIEKDFVAKVNGAVDHTTNEIAHVTAQERTIWNGKYAKPTGGIPATDLAQVTQDQIASANTHVSDTVKHITASERTKWNGAYTKPASGVPATDLVQAIQDKLDAIAVPFTKVVATAVTTVTIPATEHKIARANAFEFVVTAFVKNVNAWETVTPSLVSIDDTTKDITVTFASAFKGNIVVR